MLASNEPAAGDASTRLDEQWLGLTASEQRGADVRMVRFQKSETLSWPSQTCLHALADGAARLFRLQRLPLDLGPRCSPAAAHRCGAPHLLTWTSRVGRKNCA